MQEVHRPPFLLPTHPHSSFLLEPSSGAHKFQFWWLTLTTHTQPTQPRVVHTEKQFEQKIRLLLWLQHHREQNLSKNLGSWSSYPSMAQKFVSVPFCPSQCSPSGAACSAVPMHPWWSTAFADVHAAPFLLSCSPGWTVKTDSFSHRSLCCPMGVACTLQGMAHPVSALCLPCPQRAAQWPAQVGWALAAMSCPNTPRSPDYSWIPALIVPQCFSQANNHWLPLSTSLQCHSKLISFLLSYLLHINTISFWGFFNSSYLSLFPFLFCSPKRVQ